MEKKIPEFEYDMRVGQILKKWRKNKKITQQDMAAKIGTTRQSIVNIERGNTHAKSYTIYLYGIITGKISDMFYSDIENLKTDSDSLLNVILSKTRRFSSDMLEAVNEIIDEDNRGDLRAVLHLFSMYLRLPMRDRQNLSMIALNCYKAALERKEIPERNFMPDIELVEKCQKLGYEACVHDKDLYNMEDE